MLLLVGGLATIVILYVVSLWWIRRHGHRRLLTQDPPVRVAKAWQRADRDLRLAGVPSRPAETHLEFSDRVHASLGDVGPELTRLAALHGEATYAPPERVDGDDAAEAETASADLRTALHERFPEAFACGRGSTLVCRDRRRGRDAPGDVRHPAEPPDGVLSGLFALGRAVTAGRLR